MLSWPYVICLLWAEHYVKRYKPGTFHIVFLWSQLCELKPIYSIMILELLR